MRFLLLSADQPTVKKYIDVPDRLVKDKCNTKKVKRNKTEEKRSSSRKVDTINRQRQTSKSVISHKRHNGRSIHRRDKRVKTKQI